MDGVGEIPCSARAYAVRILAQPLQLLAQPEAPSGGVVNAVKAQDSWVLLGEVGSKPHPGRQQMNVTSGANGSRPFQIQAHPAAARVNPAGSAVRWDVATWNWGPGKLHRRPLQRQAAAGVGIKLAGTPNALNTSYPVAAFIEECAYFPHGFVGAVSP